MPSEDEEEDEEPMEYGEEDEEEDDIFEKETSNKKSKKQNKKKKESIFADYDEFAHLLEGDLYEPDNAKKHKHSSGPRTGAHHDFKRRGGRPGGKRRK